VQILAGDYIDAKLGAAFCLSTMAAAGLGNLISDIAGIFMADSIESRARVFKYGRMPDLSKAQRRSTIVFCAHPLHATVEPLKHCRTTEALPCMPHHTFKPPVASHSFVVAALCCAFALPEANLPEYVFVIYLRGGSNVAGVGVHGRAAECSPFVHTSAKIRLTKCPMLFPMRQVT
jgi:Transmembrane protein 65